MRDWLLVSEIFTTLQGEGPSAGQKALFVRLGACDLHCKWCDTSYTWAFDKRHAEMHESKRQYDPRKELKRISLIELASLVIDSGVRLCVITGGEPLLQLDGVSRLMSAVNETVSAPRFEVETAGTHAPSELLRYTNTFFNVSPKLSSSGNLLSERYHPGVLKDFAETGRARFKFVIDTRDFGRMSDDFVEVRRIIAECKIEPHDVWLMPCGTTSREVDAGLQLLSHLAIDYSYNLTGRMHVTIWGDKRGH